MTDILTSVQDPVIVQQVRGMTELSASCVHGALQQWDDVLAGDLSATLYQGREWCTAWYDCYADAFDPIVLTVLSHDKLVGVVPLCIERGNGYLHFAGAAFSDYRDVVALPEQRVRVLEALVDYYRDTGPPNVFRIGPMPPDSASATLLPAIVARRGVQGMPRNHSGWRYLAQLVTADTNPLKSKTLKYNYNWYKRNGGSIDVEVVTDRKQWIELRQIFFDQHSLRQLTAGRKVSFDDPRKAALFDRMFDAECGHFCVLRANDRVIATHFGFRSGTLLHWGAPAFDIREAARSPSLLLIAIIMNDLERWGLSGLDLTIGEGFLKERFSNVRVALPSVDLFPTAKAFHLDHLRTHIASQIKARPRVMVVAGRAAGFVTRLRSAFERHGISGSLSLLGRHARQSLWEFNTGLVFTITPGTLSTTEPKPSVENIRHGINAYEDLLCWSGSDVLTDYTIRKTAESILSNAKAGRTLHTLVVGGRLACVGLSYLPDAPAQLTETGNLPFTFKAGSASLYSFYTMPEFRGQGFYQRLITNILKWHFATGVALAYITVLENNVASLRAIERVGFRRVQRNTVKRIGPLIRTRRVDFCLDDSHGATGQHEMT